MVTLSRLEYGLALASAALVGAVCWFLIQQVMNAIKLHQADRLEALMLERQQIREEIRAEVRAALGVDEDEGTEHEEPRQQDE